jgi:hypothetical protein
MSYVKDQPDRRAAAKLGRWFRVGLGLENDGGLEAARDRFFLSTLLLAAFLLSAATTATSAATATTAATTTLASGAGFVENEKIGGNVSAG